MLGGWKGWGRESTLWDGENRQPGSMAQLSAWQRLLLRHSCSPSVLHLCSVLWAPLCGICLSFRQDCLRLQRAKNPFHCCFPLPFTLPGASGCFPQYQPLSLSTHLPVSLAHSPPSRDLMHRSVRCACVKVGRYLLGCRCSASYSFKGRGQERSLTRPSFQGHSQEAPNKGKFYFMKISDFFWQYSESH